jgi:hypothetical protein
MLHEEVDAVLLGVMGKGVSSGTRWTTSRSSTSSSKPEGRGRRRGPLPVTMTEDSWVRFLSGLEDLFGTAALGTMPWMVPVPSRKMGKSSLPEARRL